MHFRLLLQLPPPAPVVIGFRLRTKRNCAVINSYLSTPNPPSQTLLCDAGLQTLGLIFVSWLSFSWHPQRATEKDSKVKVGEGTLASSSVSVSVSVCFSLISIS